MFYFILHIDLNLDRPFSPWNLKINLEYLFSNLMSIKLVLTCFWRLEIMQNPFKRYFTQSEFFLNP